MGTWIWAARDAGYIPRAINDALRAGVRTRRNTVRATGSRHHALRARVLAERQALHTAGRSFDTLGAGVRANGQALHPPARRYGTLRTRIRADRDALHASTSGDHALGTRIGATGFTGSRRRVIPTARIVGRTAASADDLTLVVVNQYTLGARFRAARNAFHGAISQRDASGTRVWTYGAALANSVNHFAFGAGIGTASHAGGHTIDHSARGAGIRAFGHTSDLGSSGDRFALGAGIGATRGADNFAIVQAMTTGAGIGAFRHANRFAVGVQHTGCAGIGADGAAPHAFIRGHASSTRIGATRQTLNRAIDDFTNRAGIGAAGHTRHRIY